MAKWDRFTNMFQARRVLDEVIIAIVILLLFTLVAWYVKTYLDLVSIVVGFVSLLFSTWVAYNAVAYKDRIAINSAKNTIINLWKQWTNPYDITTQFEYLSHRQAEEAVQVYQYVLATAPSMDCNTRNAITVALKYLEKHMNEGTQPEKKVFVNFLQSIYLLVKDLP